MDLQHDGVLYITEYNENYGSRGSSISRIGGSAATSLSVYCEFHETLNITKITSILVEKLCLVSFVII